MKHIFQQVWVLILALCVSLTASAYDFKINGIYYTVSSDGETCSVVSGRTEYTGDITIPSEVTYHSKKMSVTSIGNYAFEDCSGLTSVIIPNSVTDIGNSAFSGCSGLTSVTIPNSVTEIGSSAFSGCSGLTELFFNAENCTTCGSSSGPAFPSSIKSVTIGENVKIIPTCAFYSCRCLTSVTIPNSVTSIGDNAFEDCSGLTSVTIPNSVTEIGSGAFYGCSGLTSVTIPNSVTDIGNSAFRGSSGLTELFFNAENCTTCGSYDYPAFPSSIKSVTIGENVKIIPTCAFYRCSGLTSVNIGNSVTTIGNSAFSGCSGLTSVTIGNSVTSIGNYAFEDCSGLTSVIIPNSVTKIGNYAFSGCSSLIKSAYPSTLSNPFGYQGIIVAYNPEGAMIEDGWIYGPDKSSILFAPYSIEGSFVIPNSVTQIGYGAFSGCSGLTSVTIPNSVTSIGDYAFYWCSGLTSVTIPNSVTSIGDYAFYWCSGLTSVTIPNSVTKIGSGAFAGCSGLTSVTIPENVQHIGDAAFTRCENLKRVNFNANECITCGVEYLVFPKTVETVVFGENVKLIAPNVCNQMANLERINIPNSVTEIGRGAFSGCSGLTSVTIPNSVTEIGSGAFSGCSGLTELFFNAENCTTCGSDSYPAFPDNTESIVVGEKVANIPDYAFKGLGKLSRITIPNSVISIGQSAFNGCYGLTMLTMGDYVESVGENAFRGCNNLTKVKIENVNAWARINFANVDANPLSYSGSNRQVGLYVGDDSELASSVVIEGDKPVGTYAFAGAMFLEQVRVKDGAPVGSGAFANCKNLKRISLNTPSLGGAAFSMCEALETVYSETTTAPSAPDDAFSKYNGVDLYVPRKCISAYEDAPTCWYRFVSISAKDMTDLDEIFVPSYKNNEIPEIIPVAEIILNETSLSIEVGKIFQLTAEIMPANATNTNLSWASSDSRCVSVDESGLLTAIAEGEATITISSADGHAQASCTVTVIADSGIDEVAAVAGAIEVYDLRGRKVGDSTDGLPKGVYIIKSAAKTTKIAI